MPITFSPEAQTSLGEEERRRGGRERLVTLPRAARLRRGGAGSLLLLISHAFHHPILSPAPPFTTCFPSPDPAQKIPTCQRSLRDLIPSNPAPQRHTHTRTHTHTHAHAHAHMSAYLERAAPWKEAPRNAQLFGGPEPRAVPLAPAPAPVSSFSPVLFLTQPPAPWPERKLHNPLGAANVAEDYSQCRGNHTPRRPLIPTTLPNADGLPAPISRTRGSRPPTGSLPAPD